jgi:hypothetical protein
MGGGDGEAFTFTRQCSVKERAVLGSTSRTRKVSKGSIESMGECRR